MVDDVKQLYIGSGGFCKADANACNSKLHEKDR